MAKNAIKAINTRVRAHLARHKVHAVRGLWVPATAYKEWREKHDQELEVYLAREEDMPAMP